MSDPGITQPTILIAEDSEAHRTIVRRAFRSGGLDADLRFVGDGEELLAYLGRAGTEAAEPWPRVVLLDLHMPGTGGIEALTRIRADPQLRRLPVVILSTSDHARHIEKAYEAGANAYLVKLGDFAGLVRQMHRFAVFWLDTSLPPAPPDASPPGAPRT